MAYTFRVGDKEYELPNPQPYVDAIDGGDYMDMMTRQDTMTAAKVMWGMLNAAKGDAPEAYAAIRHMPPTRQSEVVAAWFQSMNTGGASVPQS